MTRAAFIAIDGKRHVWRDILELRREQLRERRRAEQPAQADRQLFGQCRRGPPRQCASESEAHAAILAREVGLDMTAYWQPTAASYFGRVSKQRILQVVREGVSEHQAQNLARMKKASGVVECSMILRRLSGATGKRGMTAQAGSNIPNAPTLRCPSPHLLFRCDASKLKLWKSRTRLKYQKSLHNFYTGVFTLSYDR